MAAEPNVKTHEYYSKQQHVKLTKTEQTKTTLSAGAVARVDAAAPAP